MHPVHIFKFLTWIPIQDSNVPTEFMFMCIQKNARQLHGLMAVAAQAEMLEVNHDQRSQN